MNKDNSALRTSHSALILVVEDSQVQAEVLRRLLVDKGYSVDTAKDGAEGLAMAGRLKPALVISDINMPVMDGYEMSRRMKEIKELKGTPIIILTQLTEPDELIRGLEAGADNYVTKPFNPDFLLSKVRSLLENPEGLRNNTDKRCIEFDYGGKHHEIKASRTQTFNFIFSTYEHAVMQNKELTIAQAQLYDLNTRLEEKVKERTAALKAEIEQRKATEESLKKSEEELRKSLDEVERFNRLMVKREFRIEELRKENEKLKERIGEMEKERGERANGRKGDGEKGRSGEWEIKA